MAGVTKTVDTLIDQHRSEGWQINLREPQHLIRATQVTMRRGATGRLMTVRWDSEHTTRVVDYPISEEG